MEISSLKILITGAAGNIAYSLLPLLCSGETFGPTIKISLNLFDLPEKESILKGIGLELEDCTFPLLESVTYGSSPEILFKNVDLAIFLGGMPRKPGMERIDLLKVNGKIFKEHAQYLHLFAKEDCKVLVVANPVNTNCLILQENCPKIPASNFVALGWLDLNRSKAQVANKLGCSVSDIQNIAIWGNHSSAMHADLTRATYKGDPLLKLINDSSFISSFTKHVQKRGGEILSLRSNPAVISGAYAIRDHLSFWYKGPANKDEWGCMGIKVENQFFDLPIKESIYFSMPVKWKKQFEVEKIDLKEWDRTGLVEKIEINVKELLKERKDAFDLS